MNEFKYGKCRKFIPQAIAAASDCEVAVIIVALQQLLIRNLTFVKVGILSDSKAAVQAIASVAAATSLHVLQCRTYLLQLRKKEIHITLQ
ncbi:hypothetical protein TNCV_2863051 [Trichonephila clavipes]|nr:hypothetical protein TNCV_2863051 [Trichonephila clavipes]